MVNVIIGCIIGLVLLLFEFQVTGKEPTPTKLSGITAKVRHVVDGDSLYLSRYKPQIRLWGVDAPEKNEPGYTKASTQLKKFALGKELKCEMVDQDKYGRTIARCYLSDGQEINRMMIESGAAAEYKYFSKGYYSKNN